MRILFIRHGDPDYANDTLTEKGYIEANLLADRMVKENVREFYCSPLGRAKDTAKCTLERINREAIVYDWLKEFYVNIKDPETGNDRIPWDFMPAYWTKKPELFDKDKWYLSDVMQTGNVEAEYKKVCEGIDGILSTYGYDRKDNYYVTSDGNEDTIVFYCHLGVEFAMLSHILLIPAPILWQQFFVAPTSVTELVTEERIKGEVCFRCKRLGDISHLYAGGEIPSNSGFFIEKYK